MRHRLRTYGVFGAISLLLSWLAVVTPTTSAEVPQLALSDCVLRAGIKARCGSLEVPENRKAPHGRRIKLRVAVVPALARAPLADPLFLLAGGPGQGAVDTFPAIIRGAFERVRRSRDLVLVDQRGTGASNPLACPGDPPATLAARLTEAGSELPEVRLKKCLASYDADPRFYTTSIAMQDLDDVRAALGYAQINLYGGSYGTRAALVYLREHPTRVRSLVLDGVAPLTMRLPLHFARDAERAMQLLLSACGAEPACEKAWPDLSARFDRLLARLAVAPDEVVVRDPLTGEPSEVSIERDLLAGVVRGMLYEPALAALVPLTIARAEASDYGPLVAITTQIQDGMHESVAMGMMLSVICSEDVPRFNEQELLAESRGTFLGTRISQPFLDACRSWPRGEVSPDLGQAVRSDKPVLLLSGELDPVTPPSWADEAARTLPNSAHFVVKGVGHGVHSVGCAPRLISQFLDQGSVTALDGSCLSVQKRPPFFISFSGPTP